MNNKWVWLVLVAAGTFFIGSWVTENYGCPDCPDTQEIAKELVPWGWPAANEAEAWRLLKEMDDCYDSVSFIAWEAADSIEVLNAVLDSQTTKQR